MAVIGSTLSLPSASEILSSNAMLALFGLLVAVGLVWLVVDYVRMLMLHKKMVFGQSFKQANKY